MRVLCYTCPQDAPFARRVEAWGRRQRVRVRVLDDDLTTVRGAAVMTRGGALELLDEAAPDTVIVTPGGRVAHPAFPELEEALLDRGARLQALPPEPPKTAPARPPTKRPPIPAGAPPMGYRRPGARLVVVFAEACIIHDLAAHYLSPGSSLNRTAAALNEEGKTTRAGRPWCAQSVRAALVNPAYRGVVVVGGQSYDGGHDPIFDASTASKIDQTMRERRRNHGGAAPEGLDPTVTPRLYWWRVRNGWDEERARTTPRAPRRSRS